MGVRKNYRNLTDAERDRFVQALHHVKSTGVVDRFAEMHERHFTHGIHRSSHFLPWHREQLLRFERELQRFHPDVTIPYWDSTVDRSPSDPLWTNGFLGQFNSAWRLNRALGAFTSLPTQQQVENNQLRDNYTAFWRELEDPIHNWPHRWVGGVMADFASPGDPVFYLHHCWIDMLWARWQHSHPNVPFVSSGAGAGLNDPLNEWPDRTPADVLNHRALGYFYDTERSSVPFTPVFAEGSPGNGIGGYDLADNRDRAFAFDYTSTGRLDHLALYRPGSGTIWILRNSGGQFNPVFAEGSPGNGIGGYDLADDRDRAFAFDYTSSGRLDHLVLYRPGTGTIWILRNSGGQFAPVYAEGSPGNGIGGYDLADDRDQAFAFDYTGTGRLDHLVLYRPGLGTIWILRNSGGQFSPVFAEGSPGNGIGGYDLADNRDRAFAFDYTSSGRLDHLVLYRPGLGTIWVLHNNGGQFAPVAAEGSPGLGVGGYDLADDRDRAFTFDYTTGRLDHLAFYRPGTGTIWILRKV
jgi:hypothetical protein